MKSGLAFTLVLIFTVLCIPSFSVLAAGIDKYSLTDEQVVPVDYSDLFGEYTGAFVLYDPQTGGYALHNESDAVVRYSPQSTYKIYSALMALEDGSITPGENNAAWDGEAQPYAAWNRDHDLPSAMANSVTWYFQAFDRQAGVRRLQEFYSGIGYGSGEIRNTDTFWVDGSLRISAMEQAQLLEQFYNNTFGFDEANVQAVKDAIFLEASDGVRLYGKTGTGSTDGVTSTAGWYIGYIEKDGQVYYFATHIQGEGASGSGAAQIALSIFEREGYYIRP